MPAEASDRMIHARRTAAMAGAWSLPALEMLIGRARCRFAAIVHLPCPGCGMTRAMVAFAGGPAHWEESVRLQPLAVPMVATLVVLAVESLVATWRFGNPVLLWNRPSGRAAVLAFGAIQIGLILLWLTRFGGAFGGPVPVD